MARSYLTKDNDVLDAICYEVYGTESAVTDVLSANVHLADLGPLLPAGVEIQLPDVIITKVEEEQETLWS